MDITRKLEILADAAKYDASCASNGAEGFNRWHRRGFHGRIRDLSFLPAGWALPVATEGADDECPPL